MRTLTFASVLTTVCWLATSASAQNYRDTSGDLVNPGKAINESPTNTDIQLGVEQGITQGTYRVPNGEPESQGNHWRYRFQNSQWWYYQPNKQWVIWNGSRWVEPSSMTTNHTSTSQPKPHQSGYRGMPGMNPQQPATQGTQRSATQAAPATRSSPAGTMPNGSTPLPQNNQPVPATPKPPTT